MLLAEKRWRVASNVPLTCGPADAWVAATLAAALSTRAWLTRRFGLSATARSTSADKVGSPNSVHQAGAMAAAFAAVFAAALSPRPTWAGASGFAWGSMPPVLAQPANVITMVEARAMTSAATVGRRRLAHSSGRPAQ